MALDDIVVIDDRFAEETPTAVQERLQKHFESDIDVRQGSLVGDLTRGNAEEFANAYMMMDFVLKSVILNEDMPTDFLTLKAREYGITRYSANSSKVAVTFTGNEGDVIPANTVVRTSREPIVEFKTLNAVVIGEDETATVTAQALEGGAHTNVPASWIDTVVGDMSGVLSVSNEEAAEGGYDEQSDAELYEQVLNTIRRPITSGNVYHYEKWATDVEGIRRAKVYPLWDGNGTVKVVLLASNGVSPTNEKITEVANYIETQRPIGATVTVVGASEVAANIKSGVILREGVDIEEVTRQYKEMATLIFADTAFKTDVIRYSRMAAMLLDIPGVVDWRDFLLNGGTSNVPLSDEEIAVLGEVDLYVAED